MIDFNHCRVLTLCLLGSVFLVACTGHQEFWGSPATREIREVRSRTVPGDASPLRTSEPVQNETNVLATWEFQTKSGSGTYFQWLKGQLGPEYRITSQTTSTISLVKEIEGDSYTVAVRSTDAIAGTVIEVQLVATPD
jgi:hypothetical protein